MQSILFRGQGSLWRLVWQCSITGTMMGCPGMTLLATEQNSLCVKTPIRWLIESRINILISYCDNTSLTSQQKSEFSSQEKCDILKFSMKERSAHEELINVNAS